MHKLIFIVLLLTSFNVNAQLSNYYIPSQKTNQQENELKGNVKYTYTSTWEMVIKFGDPVKDKFTEKREWYYNKKGMYEKGTLETDRTEQKILYKYSYNKKDQVEEVKRIYDGKTEYVVTFLYNAAGNITERNEYDKKGKLDEKDKYKYDSDGYLQSITVYTGDGAFNEKKEFSWNTMNQKTEERTFNEKVERTEISGYEYGSDGNISLSTRATKGYNNSTMNYKDYYTYNSKNQVTKKLMDVNNSTGEFVYQYDSNGNVIKVMVRYGKQTTYKVYKLYTYTYDSNGNWLTKLTEYENFDEKKEYILEEREIKYW